MVDAFPGEPLIATKLYLPVPRADLVPRSRLVARLQAARNCKLILVSAPAGSGKTTLLTDWVQSLSKGTEAGGVPVAWLSLEEQDSEPARFMSYLIAAIRSIVPDAGESILSLLASSPTASMRSLVPALVNDLAASSAGGVLVLDDYHVLASLDVHETTAFLLDHLPPQFQIVIATREDPPLPLARLRARAQLTEIRIVDLRFTRDEAIEFLRTRMGLDLPPEQVEALESRTEGWIAGLQLAALSLHEHTDTAGFISAVTGTHRYVLDYLVEEVLSLQPENLQRFLLYTCIPGRICASLCAALLDGEDVPGLSGLDAQAMLEQIERSNLFLVPLDDERHWYRYHHLFAGLLRFRLEQSYPAIVPTLQTRAAHWFAEQGLSAEAIELAISANDYVYAGALISESMKNLTQQPYNLHLLRRWLKMLPDDVIRADPRLCLDNAWVLASTGHFHAAEDYVGLVEQHLEQAARVLTRPDSDPLEGEKKALAGESAVLLTFTAASLEDPVRAEVMAKRARELLPASQTKTHAALQYFLASAYTSTGRLQAAIDAYVVAESLARSTGDGMTCLLAIHGQASARVMLGDLQAGALAYRRALHLEDVAFLPITGVPHIGLGRILTEWNRLDEAAEHLDKGIALLSPIPDWNTNLVDGYVALARAMHAIGESEREALAIAGARQLAESTDRTRITKPVEWLTVTQWLYSGELEQAWRWSEQASSNEDQLSLPQREIEAMMRARVYLAAGDTGTALRVLAAVQESAQRAGRMHHLIEIEILQTLALYHIGRTREATRALTNALALAERGGYIRLFLDQGASMRALLQEVLKSNPAEAGYAIRLLAFFPAEAGDAPPTGRLTSAGNYLVEPLSEREIQVLRLLVSGLSGPQIADALTVGTSTVKTHIKNIYSKLGVHTRLQAAERARELLLL